MSPPFRRRFNGKRFILERHANSPRQCINDSTLNVEIYHPNPLLLQKTSSMEPSEALYHEIAGVLEEATEGKMFGALCIKAPNGKAGVMYSKTGLLVCKLNGADEQEALKLSGTRTFTPADNREMKGWIEIPYTHAEHWKKFAAIGHENARKIEVKPKKKA